MTNEREDWEKIFVLALVCKQHSAMTPSQCCKFCKRSFLKGELPGGFNNHVRNCLENPNVKGRCSSKIILQLLMYAARKGKRKAGKNSDSSNNCSRDDDEVTEVPEQLERDALLDEVIDLVTPAKRAEKKSFASVPNCVDPMQLPISDPPSSKKPRTANVVKLKQDECQPESALPPPKARLYRRFTILVYMEEAPPVSPVDGRSGEEIEE